MYIDDPCNDEKIKGDLNKTVFIARLVSGVIIFFLVLVL